MKRIALAFVTALVSSLVSLAGASSPASAGTSSVTDPVGDGFGSSPRPARVDVIAASASMTGLGYATFTVTTRVFDVSGPGWIGAYTPNPPLESQAAWRLYDPSVDPANRVQTWVRLTNAGAAPIVEVWINEFYKVCEGTAELRPAARQFVAYVPAWCLPNAPTLAWSAFAAHIDNGQEWSDSTNDTFNAADDAIVSNGDYQAQQPCSAQPAPAQTPADGFIAVAPTRVLDTRGEATFDCVGNAYQWNVPAATISITDAVRRVFSSASPEALALNVTITEPQGAGFAVVWSCSGQPTTSNVNFTAGQTIANSVIVPGTSVCIRTSVRAHVIVDVVGAFTSSANTDSFSAKRLIDTRPGEPKCVSGPTGLVPAGSVTTVVVRGTCGVAEQASAAVLNVTATASDAAGFLTVYPCGAARPNASSVNFAAGETIPNAVLATIGDGDAVCIYNLVAVHLVVDILGALDTPTSYEPLTPSRLLETRADVPQPGTVDDQFDGIGKPSAGGIVEFQVGGRGGVPSDARAAVLNVTSTNADGTGYFTVFPCGPRPIASNLNYVAGQTIPNAVITPLRSDGRVCVYTHAGADIIVDVSGYFPALPPG